jgi:hypothetical protein
VEGPGLGDQRVLIRPPRSTALASLPRVAGYLSGGVTPGWLRHEYVEQGRTFKELAAEANSSPTALAGWAKRWGDTRSPSWTTGAAGFHWHFGWSQEHPTGFRLAALVGLPDQQVARRVTRNAAVLRLIHGRQRRETAEKPQVSEVRYVTLRNTYNTRVLSGWARLRRPAPGDRAGGGRQGIIEGMTHLRPAPAPPSWTLAAVPYGSPDTRRLTQALRHEQLRIYGFADDPADTSAEEFTAPDGAFLIASAAGGHALACGGWRTARIETAEIKRMCVDPAARARLRAGAPHSGSAGGRRGKHRHGTRDPGDWRAQPCRPLPLRNLRIRPSEVVRRGPESPRQLVDAEAPAGTQMTAASTHRLSPGQVAARGPAPLRRDHRHQCYRPGLTTSPDAEDLRPAVA